MAVVDDRFVKKYLQKTIDKIFKILPLYEEGNKTLEEYINSLIIELSGFVAKYGSVGMVEYMSVISTLEGVQNIVSQEGNHSTVKREVFKSIETITSITDMLAEGD